VEVVLGSLARVAYMVFVATMIVVWAVSAGKSSPAEPQHEQVIENWWC
jgi:hypothetical protein